MYKKTKELGQKENHKIIIIGIEDSKCDIMKDERRVMKILENYITELCDPSNRPENQKTNMNTK